MFVKDYVEIIYVDKYAGETVDAEKTIINK